MNKGAKMQLDESGTGRYKVLLKGDIFQLVAWVDKGAVGGSVDSGWDVNREIDHPLAAEETSAYLHRFKRDFGQLMKLKTWGICSIRVRSSAIARALEYDREEQQPEERQKAQRRFRCRGRAQPSRSLYAAKADERTMSMGRGTKPGFCDRFF